MPIYFDPGPGVSELTHEQVHDVADEMMRLCSDHLRKKYGDGKVPVSFALFAGSGLSHMVCATMPQEIAAQALVDAGCAMLNGDAVDETPATLTQ